MNGAGNWSYREDFADYTTKSLIGIIHNGIEIDSFMY
jgi:hypothetical protein